ncbi:unnamed protein product [Closterium sp. NIES-64]|nr:unnamed protein product [Closterium sp. NIES-64]
MILNQSINFYSNSCFPHTFHLPSLCQISLPFSPLPLLPSPSPSPSPSRLPFPFLPPSFLPRPRTALSQASLQPQVSPPPSLPPPPPPHPKPPRPPPTTTRYCPNSGLATASGVESGSEGLAVAVGQTHKQPIRPVPGEVFALRKLLPTTIAYDFNIHIMDFEPGEFLNVKEVHYNQHGLLLLEGRGIYRLADSWYAALCKTRSPL